jgi:N-methylhydantoinase A/oxoprolinase/acetone carboxylase beta subunit
VDDDLGGLVAEVAALVGEPASVTAGLDCRYEGQSHTLTVERVEQFHDAHARRNGFALPEVAVEVVALRATATRAAPLDLRDLPRPARRPVIGPAVVAEPDATMWVGDGWRAEVGPLGAWVLHR